MTAVRHDAAIVTDVVNAIRSVAGAAGVALHEPTFDGNEWQYVKACLDTAMVSSVGAFVEQFERDLAAYTGAAHAIAVVNGTAALHVALQLAGVGPGDEVLTPTLSFIATANAITYCGATPHFVDSCERTLGVDPVALRDYLAHTTEVGLQGCVNRKTCRPIRAIVPMHTFGHPVDMEGVMALSRDFRLNVVEDAAESLGSTIDGRHTGTFGLCGTLSFNGNKTVTTGGGGAILTNDRALAIQAKHLTTTARMPHKWTYLHDAVGYNYRMPNINAALGCAQLEQLPGFVRAKRALFDRYQAAFAHIPEVSVVAEPQRCRSNYWLQTLRLDHEIEHQRDAILQATHAAGLVTRPVWLLTHRQAPYSDCPRMPVTVAEALERQLINLPSSPGLADAPTT